MTYQLCAKRLDAAQSITSVDYECGQRKRGNWYAKTGEHLFQILFNKRFSKDVDQMIWTPEAYDVLFGKRVTDCCTNPGQSAPRTNTLCIRCQRRLMNLQRKTDRT